MAGHRHKGQTGGASCTSMQTRCTCGWCSEAWRAESATIVIRADRLCSKICSSGGKGRAWECREELIGCNVKLKPLFLISFLRCSNISPAFPPVPPPSTGPYWWGLGQTAALVSDVELSSPCCLTGTFCGRRARAAALIRLSLKGSQAEWRDGRLLVLSEGQIESERSSDAEVWVGMIPVTGAEGFDLLLRHKRDGFTPASLNLRITGTKSRIFIAEGACVASSRDPSWYLRRKQRYFTCTAFGAIRSPTSSYRSLCTHCNYCSLKVRGGTRSAIFSR